MAHGRNSFGMHGARAWAWAAVLLVALAGTGCGGGGGGSGSGSNTPSASGSATLGMAGGTIEAVDGTRIDVPAGALAADTTIRVAQDGTGAPPLPDGLQAAGNYHALTPHGVTFEQPVTVRIPAPAVSLAGNQALKLAKTDREGQWTVLADSRLDGDSLVAEVDGFSYFVPVVITYPITLVNMAPLEVTQIELDCGGQSCGAAIGPIDYTLTITTNGGQVPSGCQMPQLQSFMGQQSYHYGRDVPHDNVPMQGGVVRGTVRPPVYLSDSRYLGAVLRCGTGSSNWTYQKMGPSHRLLWVRPSTYPNLTVHRAPTVIDAVAGMPARIDAVLSGGGSYSPDLAVHTPTPANHAVVDWQRSDDDGASWRTVAQSFEHEADPRPLGSSPDWRVWRVQHSFIATSTDAGALLRARACYTPPDVAPPPCATGPAARINLVQQSALPAFSEAPRSLLVRTGQTASFTAAATGAPAPTLQWQTRPANSSSAWADVAGATGTTYTTAVLGLADNGLQVRVVATNAVGEAQSPGVTVSVSDLDVAPTITTQPATLAVAAGGDAVFAVAAQGTEALSYQWRFNGNPITGANAAVLKLGAVTNVQAGRYTVVVSNVAGSTTSSEATLDVTAGAPTAVAPTIVTPPAAVTVNAGNTATFAVGVGGTAPYAYQWFKNGQPIEGATAAFHSLASATTGSAGQYSVRVSNAAGSVTSAAATLSVIDNPAPAAVTISTQPSPQVQLPGGSATFAVAASGTGPLGYQWLKNGAALGGATGPVLTLAAVTGVDAGNYSVTVTNAQGSVTSQAATLTVIGAPAITAQPAPQSVTAGAAATFSVTATGSGIGYQWTRDGVAIAGATSASYTTPVLSLGDSGSNFGVVVYSGAGVVVSHPALLTVSAAPQASPAQARGKIAAAYLHTCAITASNAVACWGYNGSGQIGTGNVQARTSPFVWSLPEPAVSVSAGANGSCAVTVSGNLWCSGSPVNTLVPTQVAGWTGVRQVAVGQMHTCVLASDATVWCWGANGAGMLGNGSTAPSSTPVQVLAGDATVLVGVQAIQAGLTHTCATMDDYNVRCWGNNTSAQAGATAGTETLRAQLVSRAKYTDQMALGGRFSCAYIGEGGVVSCWGLALDGSATTDPVANAVFSNSPAAVGAGEAMACAITDAGAVYCWGTGVMGNGNVNENQWTPRIVGGLTGALAMAGGQGHSCVLRQSGSLVCWGSNSDYQLGTGDSVVRTTPTEVTIAGGFWRP